MDLDNDDLYKKHDQLIELKRETYEKLYNRCKNTIKLTSDAGELICLFIIPKFVFGSGYPIINVESCYNYINNKLKRANRHIKTTFIEPNIIFIDWRRKHDMDKMEKLIKSNISKSNSESNPKSDRIISDRTISDRTKWQSKKNMHMK